MHEPYPGVGTCLGHYNGWIIQNCTCMELVSLSARIHFKTSIFWKSSKSVFQCPGSGSLWGSTLSNIFLNPSVCSLNSSATFTKVGRAGSVRISFQTLSEIHSGAGLDSFLGIVVPPAIRWRHSSCSVETRKCDIYTYKVMQLLKSTEDKLVIIFGELNELKGS